MVDRIEGDSSVSPQDRVIYQQQYDRAVNLFQKSLAAYEKSDEPHQKEKFKEVMDKALMVIHETIGQIKQGAQTNQLDQDYQKFLASDNPKTYQQLNSDLNNLKRG